MGCRLASSQGLPVGLPTARCRDFSASRIRDIDGAGGVPSVVDCYGQHARSHFVNVTRCSFGSGCPASYPVFLSSVSSVSNAYGTGYQLHFVSGRHDPAVVFFLRQQAISKIGFELTPKHHNSANGCRFDAGMANNCAYIRKAVSGPPSNAERPFWRHQPWTSAHWQQQWSKSCTRTACCTTRSRITLQKASLASCENGKDADSGLTRLAVLELSLLLLLLQHVEQDSY
jgi:hypothetical protein